MPLIPTVELSLLADRPSNLVTPLISFILYYPLVVDYCSWFILQRYEGAYNFFHGSCYFILLCLLLILFLLPAYPLSSILLPHLLTLIQLSLLNASCQGHLIQEVFPDCHLSTTPGSVLGSCTNKSLKGRCMPHCLKISTSHHQIESLLRCRPRVLHL